VKYYYQIQTICSLIYSFMNSLLFGQDSAADFEICLQILLMLGR
jgi:hypothetical protein